jgi:hypothetical protein
MQFPYFPGASDLYERKAGGSWRRTAGTNKVGVTWPYVAPFGAGLLVVERSTILQENRAWRMNMAIRAFGIDSRPTPKLSGPDASHACHTRIQSFRTFSSGEVLAVGTSCDHALVVERWGAGERESTLQTLTSIVPPAIRITPVDKGFRTDEISVVKDAGIFTCMDWKAWSNFVLPFEIEDPSTIRVRQEAGDLVELRFDENKTWQIFPTPEGTELAAERAQRLFRPYAPNIVVQRVERRADARHPGAGDSKESSPPGHSVSCHVRRAAVRAQERRVS